MTESDKTRFLHVANGTCTTRLIEAAGIPGTLSIWADPLHEGPVPGGLTDLELLDVRVRHHADPTAQASLDPVNDMSNWRAVIERHESYDELILWFEHDLFDQLNLIQLLTWIRARLPPEKMVSLVCIGAFPGHPRFKGLGELRPHDLTSLLGTRQPLREEQYSLAEIAWQAFREPTPEALDDLRRRDTSALPFLGPAVTRFLQEYPWISDGLSRSERRLLALAEAGTVDLTGAFPRMHDGEDAYYMTDTSFADLIEDLSSAPAALIAVTLRAPGDGPVPRGTMTLTDIGRAVLRGERDRVAMSGIDRWFGGVHMQKGAALWRWDDTLKRIARV